MDEKLEKQSFIGSWSNQHHSKRAALCLCRGPDLSVSIPPSSCHLQSPVSGDAAGVAGTAWASVTKRTKFWKLQP